MLYTSLSTQIVGRAGCTYHCMQKYFYAVFLLISRIQDQFLLKNLQSEERMKDKLFIDEIIRKTYAEDMKLVYF